VVCGYREKGQPSGDLVSYEFDVFRCGSEKSLLTCGALQPCRIHVAADRLVITLLARWPFGKNWKWVDRAVWEYSFTTAGGDKPAKRMVFSAPGLSAAQVGQAFSAYDKCLKAGRGAELELLEEAIGRMLVAALSGDAAAQKTFFSMPTALGLDAHAAEEYRDATELYDDYAAATKKVPARPGA